MKEAFQEVAINLLAQSIQLAAGNRKELDGKELGMSAAGGAIGGAAGGVLGKGLGAAGNKLIGKNMDRLPAQMVEGAITDVGADAFTQFALTGEVDAGQLGGSALSGGAGPAIHRGAGALKGKFNSSDIPNASDFTGGGADGPGVDAPSMGGSGNTSSNGNSTSGNGSSNSGTSGNSSSNSSDSSDSNGQNGSGSDGPGKPDSSSSKPDTSAGSKPDTNAAPKPENLSPIGSDGHHIRQPYAEGADPDAGSKPDNLSPMGSDGHHIRQPYAEGADPDQHLSPMGSDGHRIRQPYAEGADPDTGSRPDSGPTPRGFSEDNPRTFSTAGHTANTTTPTPDTAPYQGPSTTPRHEAAPQLAPYEPPIQRSAPDHTPTPTATPTHDSDTTPAPTPRTVPSSDGPPAGVPHQRPDSEQSDQTSGTRVSGMGSTPRTMPTQSHSSNQQGEFTSTQVAPEAGPTAAQTSGAVPPGTAGAPAQPGPQPGPRPVTPQPTPTPTSTTARPENPVTAPPTNPANTGFTGRPEQQAPSPEEGTVTRPEPVPNAATPVRRLADVPPAERMDNFKSDLESVTVQEGDDSVDLEGSSSFMVVRPNRVANSLPAIKADPDFDLSTAKYVVDIDQVSGDFKMPTGESASASRPVRGSHFQAAFGEVNGETFAVAMESYRHDGKNEDKDFGKVWPAPNYFASDVFLAQWQAVSGARQNSKFDQNVETQFGAPDAPFPDAFPQHVFRQNISGDDAKKTLGAVLDMHAVEQVATKHGLKVEALLTPETSAEIGTPKGGKQKGDKSPIDVVRGKKLEDFVAPEYLAEVKAAAGTRADIPLDSAGFAGVMSTVNGGSTKGIVDQFNRMSADQAAAGGRDTTSVAEIKKVVVTLDGTNFQMRFDIENSRQPLAVHEGGDASRSAPQDAPESGDSRGSSAPKDRALPDQSSSTDRDAGSTDSAAPRARGSFGSPAPEDTDTGTSDAPAPVARPVNPDPGAPLRMQQFDALMSQSRPKDSRAEVEIGTVNPARMPAVTLDTESGGQPISKVFGVSHQSHDYATAEGSASAGRPVAGGKFYNAFGFKEDGSTFAVAIENYRANGAGKPPYRATDAFLAQWQAVELAGANGDRGSVKQNLGRPSGDGPLTLPDSIYRQNVSSDDAKALIKDALGGAVPPQTFPAGSSAYAKIIATDNGDSTKRIVEQFNGMRQQQNSIKRVAVLQDAQGNYQLRFDVDKTAPAAPAPAEGDGAPRSTSTEQVSGFGSPDRSAKGDKAHGRMSGYLGRVDETDVMVVKRPENVFALKADSSMDTSTVVSMFDVEMTSDGYLPHPTSPESQAPLAGAKFKTAFGYTDDGRSFAVAVESYRYNGEKDANDVRIKDGVPYFASDVFLTQWQAVDALAQQNGADGIKQKDVAKQLGKQQPVAVPSGLPDSIYRQNISGTPAKAALVAIMGPDAGPYNRVATPEQAARLLTETQNGSSTKQIVDQFNDVAGRREGERMEINRVTVIREANGSFHLRLDVGQEAPVTTPAAAPAGQGQVPPAAGFGSPDQAPPVLGRVTPTAVPDGSLPKAPASRSDGTPPPHQPAPGHGNGTGRKRGRDEEPDETPDKWRRTPAYENSDAVLMGRGYLPASDAQYDALAEHTQGAKFPQPTKELLGLVDPHKVPVTPPPGFRPGSDLHNCLEGVEAYRDTHFGRPRPSGQTFTGEAELGVASMLNKRHDVPHLFGTGQPAVDSLIDKVKQGGPGAFATVMVGKEGAEGHALALVNLPPQDGKPGGPHWVDTSKKTSWPAEPGALPDRRAGDWKVWASAVDGREQTLPGMTPDPEFREHFGANDTRTPAEVQAAVRARVSTLAGLMEGGYADHSTFPNSKLVNGFLQDGGSAPLKYHQVEQQTSDFEQKEGSTSDGAPKKGAQFTNAYGFDADGRGSALMMENYKAAGDKSYFASDGFFTQWAAVHPGGRSDKDVRRRLENPSTLEIPDSLPANIYRQNVSGQLAKNALQDALAGGGNVTPEPAAPFTRRGEREGWLERQKEQGIHWGQDWQDRLDQSTPADREKLTEWKQWVDGRASARDRWNEANPPARQEGGRPLLVRMTPDQTGFQEILGKTVNGKTTGAVVSDFNLMKPEHRAEITAITIGRDTSGNLSLRFEVEPVAGGSFGSPETDVTDTGGTTDTGTPAPAPRALKDVPPSQRMTDYFDSMGEPELYTVKEQNLPVLKTDPTKLFSGATIFGIEQQSTDYETSTENAAAGRPIAGGRFATAFGFKDGKSFAVAMETYRYDGKVVRDKDGNVLLDEDGNVMYPAGKEAPYFASEAFLTQWQAAASGDRKQAATALGTLHQNGPSTMPDSIYRQNISGGPAKATLDLLVNEPVIRQEVNAHGRESVLSPDVIAKMDAGQTLAEAMKGKKLEEVVRPEALKDVREKLPTTLVGRKGDPVFTQVLTTDNGKSTNNIVKQYNGMSGDQLAISQVMVIRDGTNYHLRLDIEPAHDRSGPLPAPEGGESYRPAADNRPVGGEGGLLSPSDEDQARIRNAVPHEGGVPKRHPDPADGDWPSRINGDGSHLPGRSTNCVDTTLAVVDTYSGHPAAAGARTPEADGQQSALGEAGGRQRIETALGAEFSDLGNGREAFERLEQRLTAQGHGSQAVIITVDDDQRAHSWNAVNQNGRIVYVDGQTGQHGPDLHRRPGDGYAGPQGVFAILLDPARAPVGQEHAPGQHRTAPDRPGMADNPAAGQDQNPGPEVPPGATQLQPGEEDYWPDTAAPDRTVHFQDCIVRIQNPNDTGRGGDPAHPENSKIWQTEFGHTQQGVNNTVNNFENVGMSNIPLWLGGESSLWYSGVRRDPLVTMGTQGGLDHPDSWVTVILPPGENEMDTLEQISPDNGVSAQNRDVPAFGLNGQIPQERLLHFQLREIDHALGRRPMSGNLDGFGGKVLRKAVRVGDQIQLIEINLA
ncbi:toxin glutamine deamidase domain-containing protein [Kitasatospora sp. NPDC004289]